MTEVYCYNGRTDGLGNRLEEIVWLEAICDKLGIDIVYRWNNQHRHRHYPVLFTAGRVRVASQGDDDCRDCYSPPAETRAGISQADILAAARQVKPKFDIRFSDGVRPLGVHIRGTDRIGRDHPHFMKDNAEFRRILSTTVSQVNSLRPTHLFICADDDNYRQQLIKHIDTQIRVVEPVCSRRVGAEYRDFFALTLCSRIVMCSRFSSFAICASLIGNVPLVAFFRSEEVEQRYKAIFVYVLDELAEQDVLAFDLTAQTTVASGKVGRVKDGLRSLFRGR